MRFYRLTRDEILGMPYSEVCELISQINREGSTENEAMEDW